MQIYQGYGSRVRVDDADWIHIEPTGPLSNQRQATSVPLEGVIRAHLVDATLLRNGNLQLTVTDPSLGSTPTRTNTVAFLRQQTAQFAALHAWLMQVAEINAAQDRIATRVSPLPQGDHGAHPPQAQSYLETDRVASDPVRWRDSSASQISGRQFATPSFDEESRVAQRGLPTHGRDAVLPAIVDRLAVIDVETTGLWSTDRVVEVAVVTIDRSGQVVDEFDTLVNPLRDPGPTWIHGLNSTTLRDAPVFEDVASHLAALLNGAVVAAHNLPFDRRLLTYEFDRAGITVDWGVGLDTLPASGGRRLALACDAFDIDLRDAHRALGDARATAQLALQVVDPSGAYRPAMASPCSSKVPASLTREGVVPVEIKRPYVLELARNMRIDPDTAPYAGLLDYALADLKLDSSERAELAAVAEDLGLTAYDRKRAHHEFLNGLLDAAVDDGVVTDAGVAQISCVAALLGLDDKIVNSRLYPLRTIGETLDLQPGTRVCFTGSAETPNGANLPKEQLAAKCREYGLQPMDSVTKSSCDLLVAADLLTMSDKATSARRFGIPIASANNFLTALAQQIPLKVVRAPIPKVALVCERCGQAWMAARRQSAPLCEDCRPSTRPDTTQVAGSAGRFDRQPTSYGRNAANTTERQRRLDRCRQAVQLQREGATRIEIGHVLAAGSDTVKRLLRDGKFYEDVASDSQRFDLARRAAAARATGLTCEAFAGLDLLSKKRAEECWKDADVLFDETGQLRRAREEIEL